ncbi:MAG: carbohydrate porin [Pirellulales bacterium]|nr:carbohydrate porin [Pirellulales bacterium]
MRRLLPLAFGLVLLVTSPLVADELTIAARLEQLEAETQTLRAQLQQLRDRPVQSPEVQATPVNWAPANAEETDYYTFEQVEQMMAATASKYAWRKGGFTITPYGFLWGSMVYETERSQVGDYALYIFSVDTHGKDAFQVDARSTRIGFDVVGPRLWLFNCAASGGKVEFDFQGNFVTENKPGVLLRHAYWEVKNDDFRLLMGQTWDVIAPLNPGTIMYSVYWGAGNIGYRRAQLRFERYLKFSPYSMITLQGSLNDDIVSDFTSATDGIQGDRGGWPLIEGRVAWTLGYRGKGGQPVQVGMSGHIGEQEFDFANAGCLNPGEHVRRTYSVNVDFQVPITSRFGVQGEVFTGENLGAYLGGILQGVNPITTRSIRSTGGWVGIWYDWSSDWHSYAGYTIDDPFDQDIDLMTHGRTYNQAYFVNLTYDVTKQFKMGFEVSSWKTLYNDERPGESVRFEYMAKYGF